MDPNENKHAIYQLSFDNTKLTLEEEQEFLTHEKKIVNNYFKLSAADLLAISGDDKKYQKIVMVVFSILGVIAAFVMFELAFVFYMPTFMCRDKDNTLSKCTEKQACSSEFRYETQIDKVSLTTEFGMFCENKVQETHAKSFIFFFAGTLVMFWSVLSDKIGRLTVFYGSWVWMVKGTIISYFSTNYYMSVLGLGIAFGGVDLFYSTLFIYTNEAIGSKMRSLSNGLIFSFYGLGGMFLFVFNIWIKDYRTNFLIQFVSIVVLGLSFVLIAETPFFLYRCKKVKRLYDTLKYIAEVNYPDLAERHTVHKKLKEAIFAGGGGKFVENMEYIDIVRRKNLPKGKKKKVFITWFYVKRLIYLTVLMGNLYITYGLTLLIPQKLGIDNIYINGILLGASEMFGYLIITFVAHKTKRKKLNLVVAIATIVVAALLMAIKELGYKENKYGKILESAFSIILKLFISMNYSLVFTYGSELFPTKLRGLALGISVFIGRFLISLCSYLELFADYEDIHPMVTSAFGAVIALPFILILPETLNKKMSN